MGRPVGSVATIGGGSFQHIVEWARPSLGASDMYDTALYDTGVYDGSSSLQWNDVTPFLRSIRAKHGKERFGRRFKTASASIVLDNPGGRWLVDANGMAPGDLVRVRVIVSGSNPGGLPTPIPPGTMWMDQATNTWTSAGALIMDDTVSGAVNEYTVFLGRVNIATDTVKGGVDVTRFDCIGQQGSLARIDKDAGPNVGAGELSDVRMQRILDNAGAGLQTLIVLGVAQHTMAATDLATPALSEAQLTSETEGGDFWFNTEGIATFGTRDWLDTETRSTVVQAFFGGLTGVGVIDSRPTRDLQIVVNNASYANTGGTTQNAQDADSIARYSNRTFRRLDLLGDVDASSTFLAARAVAQLKDVRPRARTVEMPVLDTAAATFAGDLRFGDLVQSTVDSIFGWSHTFQAHVIGIDHDVFEDQWTVTYNLDDAFIVDTTDGGFDNQAFSTGFSLGEV